MNGYVQGNNVGGVIGGGTVNARDIKLFRDRISKSISDPKLQVALSSARDSIETMKSAPLEKINAADSLGQLTQELEKPNPKPGVVKRCLGHLKEYAEPVYKTLLAVKVISDLYGAAS